MHPTPLPLETKHLELTPFVEADADALHRLFLDDHVRRYLLDGARVDRAWLIAEIEASAQRFEAGGIGLYAARLRATGELVGFTGFRPDHEPPVMELVFALLPAHCGQGLATEMGRAMIDLAFGTQEWSTLHATADAPNLASIRVLERLGFKVSGESPGAFGKMLHHTLAREAVEGPPGSR